MTTTAKESATDTKETKPEAASAEVRDAFRRWGYLQADLDWLGRLEPAAHAELDVEAPEVEELRRAYCGTLAVEFMHMLDPERRGWIQAAMESEPEPVEQSAVLDLLMRATLFEEVLQSRYIGNKRFSIEGCEALLPLLAETLEEAAELGVERAMLGMSHRGRLNVMVHIVGNKMEHVLAGFEEVDPRSIMGAGDVKYHLGATGRYGTRNGREVSIHLASNPSHLEAIDPVLAGRVRARQDRAGDGAEPKILPIVMHGDSAFAGQGILAETFNLAEIPGFEVGGTLHVIVNNWIGFTTEPSAYGSTRFASDLAKRLPIPIFHVNAEDPEAAVRAARLALRYRQEFASDVVVDLIGYRRHGHSEIDDPTVTQPLLYKKIEKRPPLWQSYGEQLPDAPEDVEAKQQTIRGEVSDASRRAEDLKEIPLLRTMPDYWEPFTGGRFKPEYDEVETGLEETEIEQFAERLTTWPADFHIHPKIQKGYEERRKMAAGEVPVDYGMAEALAFASLVDAGVPVRLSGQDTRRGTFAQRQSVLIDVEDGSEYCSLQHIGSDQARFQVYDTALSEAAALGFEYGYSRDYPETLVLWEAQFGDFANNAQMIFDQFITAGEDKWGLLSGVVALLPHGYEGQGPEHSSARLERFLQLAAEDSIQVAQPSTAAQYFHLLRRQALRKWRTPLIVLTPKSMLRHKAAASPIESFSRERFWTVRPEKEIQEADRVLLCTGKITHALDAERRKRGADRVAIVSLEQLYPFPEAELLAELDRFRSARDLIWVQEEPANMGALFFVVPRIERLARGRHVRTVKRSASASPATGSGKAHDIEQETLIQLAFV